MGRGVRIIFYILAIVAAWALTTSVFNALLDSFYRWNRYEGDLQADHYNALYGGGVDSGYRDHFAEERLGPGPWDGGMGDSIGRSCEGLWRACRARMPQYLAGSAAERRTWLDGCGYMRDSCEMAAMREERQQQSWPSRW